MCILRITSSSRIIQGKLNETPSPKKKMVENQAQCLSASSTNDLIDTSSSDISTMNPMNTVNFTIDANRKLRISSPLFIEDDTDGSTVYYRNGTLN